MENNMKTNTKMAFQVNTILTVLVILMMAIYHFIGARFLVIYSIFVTIVYLCNYILIFKGKLRLNLWSTYTMLTIYMALCTIMLGYEYGFNLYALSTIVLIYYMRYISFRMNSKDPHPNFWAPIIAVSCVISSLYVVFNGPVYPENKKAALIFLTINISSVCFFLIVFSRHLFKLIYDSEDKLKRRADYDALTGLANRYYIVRVLEGMMGECSEDDQLWVAMLDIDNFKKINDAYGHNTGDKVLTSLSKVMSEVCKDCVVGRWGGEEFLICGKTEKVSPKIVNTLVSQVQQTEVDTGETKIHFTITSGVSSFAPDTSMDSLIRSADEKLYFGKNNGKNQVVY